jgi:excisionase family DNA binding protein
MRKQEKTPPVRVEASALDYMRENKAASEKKKYVPDRGRLLERVAYRPGDLPAVTGLGLRTIAKVIATGELKSFRRGRCRLIRRDDLDAFLSAGVAETASEKKSA